MGSTAKAITAKEKMLKNIRQALLNKKDHPFPQFEESSLFENFKEPAELVFVQKFIENGGHFIYCADEIQLAENLLNLSEERSFRKMYAWETSIQHFLNNFEFPYYYTDHGFNDAEVSITRCESLVARTGSILVSNAEGGSRKLSVFPATHIVFASTSQIVPEIADALANMQKKYGHTQPSMTSLISGPSRTADIEKTLVMGAHGPKELYLFLLEDSTENPF